MPDLAAAAAGTRLRQDRVGSGVDGDGYKKVRRAEESGSSAEVRGQCHVELAQALTMDDGKPNWLLDLPPWLEAIVTDAGAYRQHLAHRDHPRSSAGAAPTGA